METKEEILRRKTGKVKFLTELGLIDWVYESMEDYANQFSSPPRVVSEEEINKAASKYKLNTGFSQDEISFLAGANFVLSQQSAGDGYAILPTDEEVAKWFELNIGQTPCSASSAIYKFRLWLKEKK